MKKQIEISLLIKVNIHDFENCTEEEISQELFDKLQVGVEYDQVDIFNVTDLKVNNYNIIN